MLEWALVAMCVGLMIRLAGVGQRNGGLWGAVTALICVGALFVIPWPFLRVGIGLVVSFIVVTIIEIASGARPH